MLGNFCMDTRTARETGREFLSLRLSPSVCLQSFIPSIHLYLPVYQPADPLEETGLPGIVFRLSSLTITKALIRLDSPSSTGSDSSLVLLLCLLLGVVKSFWFVLWGICDGSCWFPKSILVQQLDLHEKVERFVEFIGL